jgi:hypothetical protein
MDEFTPALLVTVIGAVLALTQAARFSPSEASLLRASFAAHVFSALMEVWLIRGLYGGGDFFSYATYGDIVAGLLRMDFWQFAPELVKLAVGPRANVPFELGDWAGSSTGAMIALGAFLSYFTTGKVYTLCLAVAAWAYFGQVALYQAFRESFPVTFHRRLLVATLLIPSCVFWSSALLKESVAIGGMGYAVLGFVRARKGRLVGPFLQIAIGAAVVGLVKAYILFALVAAAGAWLFCQRERAHARALAPMQIVFGAAVAVGGLALLTLLFPEFSIGTFAGRAASYQGNVESAEGGSNYTFGDATRTTLAGQLAFAPLALVTSLFRPFLFEALKPQIAAAALETTAFMVMTYRALRRRPLRDIWRIVSGSPPLAFCAVFCAIFGVGVGLTTTNLGTLSRYRMPLIPFFAALLLVLDAPFLTQGLPFTTAPPRALRPRVRSARTLPGVIAR